MKDFKSQFNKISEFREISDHYEILPEVVGKGRFGVIKKGRNLKSGQIVAIKELNKKRIKSTEMLQTRREVDALKVCKHSNIVQVYDFFENLETIYIVMEFCGSGDLFEYLDERRFNLSSERVRQIAFQLANAVSYLHEMGIMHRDIKLENVIMTDNTESAAVKLVDFGLAKIIGPECRTKEPFGPVGYCAPEILLGKPYQLNCDLWSLGCLIYAMVCECLPFDSDSDKKTIEATCKDELTFDSP